MRKLALSLAVAGSALASGLPADATSALGAGPVGGPVIEVAQGCGPGFHRGPYGRCIPNYDRPVYRGCPRDRFGRCIR